MSSAAQGASGKGDKVRLIGVGGVRHVSEASFDFLHTEMVHYFARQISKQDSGAPPDQQNAQLTTKLEVQHPSPITHHLTAHRTHHAQQRQQSACSGDQSSLLTCPALALCARVCVWLYGSCGQGLGFSVGQRLADRYTKDLHFLSDQLDVIKFLCKDFWLHVFQRQVDKLQTNHRGVYVLHDVQCRTLAHCAPLQGMTARELEEQQRVLLAFSCGLIRGALSNLGLTATVRADIVKGAACHFTITDTERARRAEEQQQQQPQLPQPAQQQQHAAASAYTGGGAAAPGSAAAGATGTGIPPAAEASAISAR